MPSSIPSPQTPLIDPATGMMSHVWFTYFATAPSVASLTDAVAANTSAISALNTEVGTLITDVGTLTTTVTANTNAIIPLAYAQQSGFRAYRSTTLIVSSSTQQIICDTEQWDQLSEYNIATGIWTPTVTGKYLLSGSVGFLTQQNDGQDIELFISINGTKAYTLFFTAQGDSVFPKISGSTFASVIAGQAYTMSIDGQVLSSIDPADGATWFSAMQLR